MGKIIQTISCWKFILILSSLFFCFQTFSYAADVTLAWDANTEPNLAGYKLYYKTGSCCAPYNGKHPINTALNSPIDVSNVTQYTITGLSDTEIYFFVATAYDNHNNESGYSNEVCYIPSTLILTGLSLSGNDSLIENTIASYSDDSEYSSISSSGLLTTLEVSKDEKVTIQASFTHGEKTKAKTKVVTIVDVPESNLPPKRPIIVYPYDGQIECDVPLDITTEPFSDADGDSHSQSRWQISKQSDFSILTIDATSNRHLTTLTVPHTVLKSEETYYVRVRFYDAYFSLSNWSDPVEFTTGSSFDDLNSNGISDAWEVDDTVDSNLDSIPDNYQPEIIKCVRAVNGSGYIAIERSSNSISEIEALEVIDPATIPDFADSPGDVIFVLFSFRIRLNEAGATAKVKIYFSDLIPSDYTLYKYDTINGWYGYSKHTNFNNDMQSVILEIQDGGYGDSDGVSNGIIVKAGGIAFGSTDDNASIGDTAAFGSIMEQHVRILWKFRIHLLLKSKIGKRFVDFYDKISPPIADYLRMHPIAKKAVRYALIPVIGLVYLILYVHPLILLLGFSFMFIGLVYGLRRFFRST